MIPLRPPRSLAPLREPNPHSLRAPALLREIPLLVLALLAFTLIPACGEEPADDDLVAGTGSTGGNPATVTFLLSPPEDAPIEWTDGRLAAVTVTFGRQTDAGCDLSEEGYELGALVEFNGAQLASIDSEDLCRIRFEPSGVEPLIEINGVTPRRPILVELFLPNGLDLVFERDVPLAEDGETPVELIVAVDPEELVDSFDLAELVEDPADIVRISDRNSSIAATLIENLIESFAIFVDPTPGDQRITFEERTPENRIGGVEIVPDG